MTPATLTGTAIGDALGMPWETQDPFKINSWDGSFGSSPYHKLTAGQWTDDTQMSLALARSLVGQKVYDPTRAALEYVGWFQGSPRGYGGTTETAMRRLGSGQPWTASGVPGAQGNGTAMRISPLGLFHYRSPNRLQAAANDARTDAGITHKSPEAQEGSATIAMSVCHLASGGKKDTVIAEILPFLTPGEIMNRLIKLAALRSQGASFDEVRREFNWELSGVPGHILETVPGALTAFLYHDTFEDTVIAAVKMGGDTDTTAAIAGALAGTHYGYENIPVHLREGIEDAAGIRDLERKLLG